MGSKSEIYIYIEIKTQNINLFYFLWNYLEILLTFLLFLKIKCAEGVDSVFLIITEKSLEITYKRMILFKSNSIDK